MLLTIGLGTLGTASSHAGQRGDALGGGLTVHLAGQRVGALGARPAAQHAAHVFREPDVGAARGGPLAVGDRSRSEAHEEERDGSECEPRALHFCVAEDVRRT